MGFLPRIRRGFSTTGSVIVHCSTSINVPFVPWCGWQRCVAIVCLFLGFSTLHLSILAATTSCSNENCCCCTDPCPFNMNPIQLGPHQRQPELLQLELSTLDPHSLPSISLHFLNFSFLFVLQCFSFFHFSFFLKGKRKGKSVHSHHKCTRNALSSRGEPVAPDNVRSRWHLAISTQTATALQQ